jgi:kynureninase
MSSFVEEADRRDAADPLAPMRQAFHLPEGVIYLDGNSLGAMPKRASARVRTVLEQEWAERLIRSWTEADWINLPLRVGDRIAPLIGARLGEVVVGDSTSVNLFKCLGAALALRPGRRVILTEQDNFPTDNYIVEGVARSQGMEIRYVPAGTDPREVLDESVAVVLLTQVNYRTAAMHDLAALTAAAHRVGAVMIWDLSHSVGVMPLDVRGAAVDFAVGCTYKYLNGGPGAPAFTYVAPVHAASVAQPLSGWMGHKTPFAFAQHYEPGAAIRRYLCGTPQILSLAALDESLAVWDGVDMAVVRQKSLAMTQLFMDLVERLCAGYGLEIFTPRGPQRGSHVSIAWAHGYPVIRAMIERGVIGDFRAPNLMRFGFAPLYGSYAEVAEAVRILQEILATEAWRDPKYATVLTVT